MPTKKIPMVPPIAGKVFDITHRAVYVRRGFPPLLIQVSFACYLSRCVNDASKCVNCRYCVRP